jgi:hypothetical protein
MAYADVDMQAKLFEQGFHTFNAGGADGFSRLREGQIQTIVCTWERQDRRSLEVPPPDEVFWIASVGVLDGAALRLVVPAAERCPDPITCFVSAEVRGWSRMI